MKRVLIIEDETAIAELEKDYLELSDFEVTIASDGVEGLGMALEDEYDLVILDLMLPGMDGFEICKRIREEKNTPILMVSAQRHFPNERAERMQIFLAASIPSMSAVGSASAYPLL